VVDRGDWQAVDIDGTTARGPRRARTSQTAINAPPEIASRTKAAAHSIAGISWGGGAVESNRQVCYSTMHTGIALKLELRRMSEASILTEEV